MAKLIDLMRQAGVQWPEGAEYAAQDACSNEVYFFSAEPTKGVSSAKWDSEFCLKDDSWCELAELASDWETALPRDVWCTAARNTERRDLVRELMLRHPELTGPQAIERADEILSTLEGLRDGR
ncbi:hypothetical protein ACR2VJ_27075 [Klebsiella pneumoniae]